MTNQIPNLKDSVRFAAGPLIGAFVQREDTRLAVSKCGFDPRTLHGLIVQREDATFARSKSGFESRSVHKFTVEGSIKGT